VLILDHLINLKRSGEARHTSIFPLPSYVLLRTLSCAWAASLPLCFGVQTWFERFKFDIIQTKFPPSWIKLNRLSFRTRLHMICFRDRPNYMRCCRRHHASPAWFSVTSSHPFRSTLTVPRGALYRAKY
jgi:hypothetical protein